MTFKETVFLPRTSLPTKAKPENELQYLAGQSELYRELRQARKGATPFVFHDGPPYANGNIHVGHALNKVLKDMTVRTHNMLGHDSAFFPGWDCHGLPIEWKVEEEWRKEKRDKNDDPQGFRMACRRYAKEWVTAQSQQFKRLGVLADWDDPLGTYRTMTPEAESAILYEFHRLVEEGLVYRANKPVLWSHVERTALAEAETVDREHIVPNVWVKFKVLEGDLTGANVLVWTTTPWSLPGNVAVGMSAQIEYGLYRQNGEKYIVADKLAASALQGDYERLSSIHFGQIMGKGLEHPLVALGYPLGYNASLCTGAFHVHDRSGTGFVHIAPSHSADDWQARAMHRTSLGMLPFPNPVQPDGTYGDDVPGFAGVAVVKGKKMGPANDLVVASLDHHGTLYRVEYLPLTLQHSWRSDAVLVTRATPQWFIDLKHATQDAITALDKVDFQPPHAKARMISMLEGRPDWLVSRQRQWGTPLAMFVDRDTGEPCLDRAVLGATHQMLADLGTEVWFETTPEQVFKAVGRTDWDDYERVDDVLDVWFDSACVHMFSRDNVADVVIEGHDQTRGWFQSSLLLSVLRGRGAPYRNVLCHGFVLDEKGRKMSKSDGNVVDPLKVIDEIGADALRLWVASVDSTEDVRMSKEALKTSAEMARKLRNTMRYVVGALHEYAGPGFGYDEDLPELERYILHKLECINDDIVQSLKERKFSQYAKLLNDFCVTDLSSLFFDIRKDALYCDAVTSPKRRAYQFVLARVFDYVVRWLAPVMPFCAEELWQARRAGSVHLQFLPETQGRRDEELAKRWTSLLEVRTRMMSEIEALRARGDVGSAGEVKITVEVQQGSEEHRLLTGVDLSELAITGSYALVSLPNLPEMRVVAEKIMTDRCDRCWKHAPVTAVEGGNLCGRCREVVSG